ncbi:hypothetical protein TeGR_g14572 [Tetraparma gracilis]|uniref:TLC domain-containing protein n=1 Tax=Tetraparma gracilis TaxID=2962635 RepID=A0ABQ6M880_9STRA|nr:hypothetical protein TeGR_g14572 [Tetraparma gracilis]
MWTPLPAGHDLLQFFAAYQLKNLYDTVVWDDGALFVAHHVLSGLVAWGGMHAGGSGGGGLGQVYAVFFMGISEVSTALLVLLANFDDELGVPGLADAFPTARIVLGAAFTVAFVFIRIAVWPWVAYLFLRDVRAALRDESDELAKARRPWLLVIGGILGALTILQFVWLAEIASRGWGEAVALM